MLNQTSLQEQMSLVQHLWCLLATVGRQIELLWIGDQLILGFQSQPMPIFQDDRPFLHRNSVAKQQKPTALL